MVKSKLISGYVLEVALTDASTITWNAATQPVAKVTLGASRTMGLPANSKWSIYIITYYSRWNW